MYRGTDNSELFGSNEIRPKMAVTHVYLTQKSAILRDLFGYKKEILYLKNSLHFQSLVLPREVLKRFTKKKFLFDKFNRIKTDNFRI